MERAATTASSLEAKQDSGDVDAQTRFEITSKQSNDPLLPRGYALRSGEDSMKLLELMELFIAVKHMLMLPVQVPTAEESSIRSDLHLDDAEGTDCLPTPTIFEELACMGFEKPSQKLTFYKAFFSPQWKYFIHTIRQCLSAKSTAWNEFSIFANMKRDGKDFSRRITPLFDTMMVQAYEEVGEDSDHPTDSNQIPIIDQPSTSSQPKKRQKSKKVQRKEVPPFLTWITAKSDQRHIKIASLKKRVDKLEKRRKFRTTGLKRLKKVGMSKRVESSEDQESLGDHEDASKQGRRIEDIDADAEVTLVNETQEMQDEDLMFDTGVLDGDEMFVDTTTGEKDEQSIKLDDSTAGEVVTTAGVEDSADPTIPTTVEETLAQTLMEIKAAKPKAKGIVFHDLEKQDASRDINREDLETFGRDESKQMLGDYFDLQS
ncbi:hypothetical protein Tco_0228023 [Tanacetum coccineum]